MQEVFHRWEAQSRRKQDLTEAALRAALSADAIAYDKALDGLRPGVGSKGKLLQTVFLTKAAFFIRLHKRPDLLANVSERIARASVSSHSITLNWGPAFADRFTVEESILLWQRFARMEELLHGDREQFMPAFQAEAMTHAFIDMPTGFGVNELTSIW